MSCYVGFIPKRALELGYEEKRRVGGPRWRWFGRLVEEEKREGLERNCKVNAGDFGLIDPKQMKRMLEEVEGDMQVVTR
jgi:hypothetical protein